MNKQTGHLQGGECAPEECCGREEGGGDAGQGSDLVAAEVRVEQEVDQGLRLGVLHAHQGGGAVVHAMGQLTTSGRRLRTGHFTLMHKKRDDNAERWS